MDVFCEKIQAGKQAQAAVAEYRDPESQFRVLGVLLWHDNFASWHSLHGHLGFVGAALYSHLGKSWPFWHLARRTFYMKGGGVLARDVLAYWNAGIVLCS